MRPVYLLDTNVISEFTKPFPNSALLKKVREYGGMCAICATVWQESVYGYERLPEGKRKNKLSQFIEKIRETYDILPYDDFSARICGEIRARCAEKGTPAPAFDSQIAATAIANNMILITHNTEDFAALKENSMLKVEDWWE